MAKKHWMDVVDELQAQVAQLEAEKAALERDLANATAPAPKPFPKTARQQVIEAAFPDDAELRKIAGQEATYTGNCVGGRPSDAARTAVRYVKLAWETGTPERLASPTARQMMKELLGL